jgi:hypothetical protein
MVVSSCARSSRTTSSGSRSARTARTAEQATDASVWRRAAASTAVRMEGDAAGGSAAYGGGALLFSFPGADSGVASTAPAWASSSSMALMVTMRGGWGLAFYVSRIFEGGERGGSDRQCFSFRVRARGVVCVLRDATVLNRSRRSLAG